MDKLGNKKLAIIGIGNMGKALTYGLLRQRKISPSNLILSNPTLADLIHFKKLRIKLTSDNRKAAKNADIIILAVKPQVISSVLQVLKHVVSQDQLIISIAAGVEIKTIKSILGKKQAVARIMPNLCAKVGESMSCWVKSKEVTRTNAEIVRVILQTIGKEILLEKESLLDQVTAISGSGPAYVFYFAELFVRSAIELGIDNNLAQELVLQTLVGSVLLLENSQEKAAILKQQVTSKGGTTEAAFNVFNKSDFGKIFMKAINAAYKRSKELHIKS